MKNLLNILLLIPFLLILSTVFIINDRLADATVSGKIFWFCSCIIIVSIVTLFLWCINKFRFHFSKTDIFVLVFAVTGLLLSYLKTGINTKWILLLLIVILYFYFRVALSGNKINRYILNIFLLITGLIEGLWGLSQLYGFSLSQHSQFILTGSFFNPGPYSGYLSLVGPMAFYYILKDYSIFGGKFQKTYLTRYIRFTIAFLTFAAIILVLPAAMSRAAWIAFIAGCLFAGIMFVISNEKVINYILENRKKAKSILFISLLGIAIASVGMYYMKKDSADGRALIWKTSLKTIYNNPTGVGLGRFSASYAEQQAAYFESRQGTEQEIFVAGAPEYGFNEYLQICMELGIMSFLLFICIIITALHFGYRRNNIPEMASLISLLIFASMSYPFNVLPFLIVLVFLLAGCVTEKEVKNESGKKTLMFRLILSLFLLLSVEIIAICGYNRYDIYEGYKKWADAKQLYHRKYFPEAEYQYRKIYPLLKDNIAFMYEYGHVLSATGKFEESNEILKLGARMSGDAMFHNIMGKNYQALKQYELAEKCFITSSHIIPNRHYPVYLLAKLYHESGDINRAREFARYVIDKKPKVPSRFIEDMREEMEKLLNETTNE